jgi:hypothetical protein
LAWGGLEEEGCLEDLEGLYLKSVSNMADKSLKKQKKAYLGRCEVSPSAVLAVVGGKL